MVKAPSRARGAPRPSAARVCPAREAAPRRAIDAGRVLPSWALEADGQQSRRGSHDVHARGAVRRSRRGHRSRRCTTPREPASGRWRASFLFLCSDTFLIGFDSSGLFFLCSDTFFFGFDSSSLFFLCSDTFFFSFDSSSLFFLCSDTFFFSFDSSASFSSAAIRSSSALIRAASFSSAAIRSSSALIRAASSSSAAIRSSSALIRAASSSSAAIRSSSAFNRAASSSSAATRSSSGASAVVGAASGSVVDSKARDEPAPLSGTAPTAPSGTIVVTCTRGFRLIDGGTLVDVPIPQDLQTFQRHAVLHDNARLGVHHRLSRLCAPGPQRPTAGCPTSRSASSAPARC